MFDLANKGIVAWPFDLAQSNGDGTFTDVHVVVRYRIFSREELREHEKSTISAVLGKIYELVLKKAPAEEIERARDEAQQADREQEKLLLDRIVGWSGFGNAESGQEVEYTPELGRAVIAWEPHYQRMWSALLDASRLGKPKNSSAGPDGQPAPSPSTKG